jgi:hypothetical protein
MSEINWWIWAGLWLVAWGWQNVVHELSHLWNGWIWEGRKPVKFVPWMHRYEGRFYFARYESGLATENGSPRRRHSAPIRWAAVQIAVGLGGLWALIAYGEGASALYMVPLLVCPAVDAGFWLWGLWARRPGTDGDRWRRQLDLERGSADRGTP